MRKLWSAALACLLLALPAAATAEAEYELNVAHTVPTTHPIHTALTEILADVERQSGGRLAFHIFDNSTLAKSPQMLKAVGKGGADMGLVPPCFFPGDLPCFATHDMPFLSDDVPQGVKLAQAMTRLPEVQAELERANIAVWFCSSGEKGAIASLKTPIRTMADIKGKRVLTTLESFCQEIEAWGGVPVQVTAPDMYVGLQRGLGDAVYMPIPTVFSQRLHELARHVTIIPSQLTANTISINRDLLEDLPADLRALLMDAGGDKAGQRLLELTEKETERQLEAMQAAGVELIVLTPEEQQPWREASIRGMEAYWRELLQRGGVADPAAWMEKIRALAASLHS